MCTPAHKPDFINIAEVFNASNAFDANGNKKLNLHSALHSSFMEGQI